MLALAGVGHAGGRSFGFASCNRTVGASEGMNVLMHRHSGGGADAGSQEAASHEYGVTNIEYTEFERLGISDVPTEAGGSESCFPANTNILYVGALLRAMFALCPLCVLFGRLPPSSPVRVPCVLGCRGVCPRHGLCAV